METPFVFGRIACDKNFTDRKEETRHLVSNFASGINTILISPRRWGKSSLVHKAAQTAAGKSKSLRFCFIDLYNTRTEEQFYQQLAREVLRASSSKWEEMMESAKQFMGRLMPRITFSPEQGGNISLSFDWKEVKKQPDEILNLAENIAAMKKLRFVICIDEFQNITSLGDSLALQKKLRSHWQRHRYVSYCLFGSKRHMLMYVFTSYNMPFYKFGDVIFLQKISEDEMAAFIIERFAGTGKKISDENARLIIRLADCHPYYVQQLAQLAWLRCARTCARESVNDAHESLVLQLDFLFQAITDDLSNTQLNFLKALTMGAEQLSAQKTLLEFGLGTSANVLQIKNALKNKEIIDVQQNTISFLDPIYMYWLKNNYFKR